MKCHSICLGSLLVLVIGVTSVFSLPQAEPNTDQSKLQSLDASTSNREPKGFLGWGFLSNLFPAFSESSSSISNSVSGTFSRNSLNEAMSVILPQGSVPPLLCKTNDDDIFKQGVCQSISDCAYYEGASYGRCAGIFGSCCVYEKTCGKNSNLFVTQFTNPRYPTATVGTGECKLTVNPMHSNICQYRLDFDEFSIAQPDASSNCVNDFLGVTGGTAVPKMCGDLTGQHVYINMKPGGGPIELSMDTSTTLIDSRTWNIRITQIPCDSPHMAPPGCIQFYNQTSGTIRSLNFNNMLPEEDTTRQLKRHNYGVCINSKVGYCELTWTASEGGSYSFTVSGDATLDKELFETLYGPENCTTDFVTIPGGRYEDQDGDPKDSERYCGTKFPARVRTTQQPYRMYINTDENEEGDKQNAGFALNFRHSLC